MENSLEEKLSAILSDPDMMGKIQAMAQSLGQSASPQPPQQQSQQPQQQIQQPQQQIQQPRAEEPKVPDIDFSMLQRLSGLAGQTGIDKNQQTLLSALSPYMSQAKVSKLENAMRAAKLAKLASGFLGSGAFQALMGR